MKRIIYIVLTLVSALSLGGCSSAISSKDLTIIEEAENQDTIQDTSIIPSSRNGIASY